jgi:hypothetical protein
MMMGWRNIIYPSKLIISAPQSTEHDDIIMNFSKMYLEMQLIDRRPTVDEAFGKNCTLCPQSRDPQMIDIVKAINETNKTSTQSKRGSFFFMLHQE